MLLFENIIDVNAGINENADFAEGITREYFILFARRKFNYLWFNNKYRPTKCPLV